MCSAEVVAEADTDVADRTILADPKMMSVEQSVGRGGQRLGVGQGRVRLKDGNWTRCERTRKAMAAWAWAATGPTVAEGQTVKTSVLEAGRAASICRWGRSNG